MSGSNNVPAWMNTYQPRAMERWRQREGLGISHPRAAEVVEKYRASNRFRELGVEHERRGFAIMDAKATEKPALSNIEQEIRARIAARRESRGRTVEGHELKLSR